MNEGKGIQSFVGDYVPYNTITLTTLCQLPLVIQLHSRRRNAFFLCGRRYLI